MESAQENYQDVQLTPLGCLDVARTHLKSLKLSDMESGDKLLRQQFDSHTAEYLRIDNMGGGKVCERIVSHCRGLGLTNSDLMAVIAHCFVCDVQQTVVSDACVKTYLGLLFKNTKGEDIIGSLLWFGKISPEHIGFLTSTLPGNFPVPQILQYLQMNVGRNRLEGWEKLELRGH